MQTCPLQTIPCFARYPFSFKKSSLDIERNPLQGIPCLTRILIHFKALYMRSIMQTCHRLKIPSLASNTPHIKRSLKKVKGFERNPLKGSLCFAGIHVTAFNSSLI